MFDDILRSSRRGMPQTPNKSRDSPLSRHQSSGPRLTSIQDTHSLSSATALKPHRPRQAKSVDLRSKITATKSANDEEELGYGGYDIQLGFPIDGPGISKKAAIKQIIGWGRDALLKQKQRGKATDLRDDRQEAEETAVKSDDGDTDWIGNGEGNSESSEDSPLEKTRRSRKRQKVVRDSSFSLSDTTTVAASDVSTTATLNTPTLSDRVKLRRRKPWTINYGEAEN